MKKIIIEEQKLSQISFPKIFVCYDKISNRLTQVFSPKELKEYFFLYESAQKKPKNSLPSILSFQKKHPHLPEGYNLLSFALIQQKKIKKAEKLIEENYHKNPDYLFARVNYADLCLRKNKTSEIAHIFEGKTLLSELYPEKECYHFSEVMSFTCLMGFYYLKMGQKEIAMDYAAYAKIIDSEDETLALLQKKIYKRSFIQTVISALGPKKKLTKL